MMNDKSGIPTEETLILVCQCGKPRFETKRLTKTSIVLTCRSCGLPASVKGNVAPVRIREAEVAYAIEKKIIRPDPDAVGTKSQKGQGVPEPSSGEGHDKKYTKLRFGVMLGDQHDVINRAMEAVRVLNCKDGKFRDQQWRGHALEYICADFLSGVDPTVLAIVDAQEEAVRREVEKIEAENGDKKITKRKIRQIRADVRDEMFDTLEKRMAEDDADTSEKKKKKPPAPKAKEPQEPNADDDGSDETEEDDEEEELEDEDTDDEDTDDEDTDDEDDDEEDDEDGEKERVVDDSGVLLESVVESFGTYVNECTVTGLNPPDTMVVPEEDINQVIDKWNKNGGYLLKIVGDDRVTDEDGNTPVIYAWFSEEHDEIDLEFQLEYEEMMDDVLQAAALHVFELVPADYNNLPAGERWGKPDCAEGREILDE